MRRTAMSVFAIALGLFASAPAARAASGGTSLTVSHSGYLLDANDQPLSTASQSMLFRVVDADTGGLVEWEGLCASVPVAGGYYALVLGSAQCEGSASGGLDPTLDTSDLPAGTARWLEMKIGSTTLAPRIALAAAPTAATAGRALTADLLGTHPASDFAFAAHAHAFSQVTGLQAALDGKLSAEADPKIGTLAAGKWCTSDGATVSCTEANPTAANAGQATGGTASPVACAPATAGYFWYDASIPAVKVCNGATYVNVSAVAAPPGPPTPTATRGNGQVTVSWTAVSGATSYEVEYQQGTTLDANATLVPVASGTSTTLTGLTNNTTYAVAVRTRADGWASAWSSTTTATPTVLVVATGGTTSDVSVGGVNYRVHRFASGGTFTVTTGGAVEYLVVAGGGGGGGGYNHGGGGGAGGLQTGSATVSAQDYAIVVGAGGAGPDSGTGGDGGPSGFAGVSTIGGGGGGAAAYATGRPGGSGGGGCALNGQGGNGTAGQGTKGGTGSSANLGGSDSGAGGGGGAGDLCSPQGATGPFSNSPGGGGAGIQSSLTGTAQWYAAGGNGAGYYASTSTNGIGGYTAGVGGGASATAGVANTGSGGGGGRSAAAGAGGSGVVILRYQLP